MTEAEMVEKIKKDALLKLFIKNVHVYLPQKLLKFTKIIINSKKLSSIFTEKELEIIKNLSRINVFLENNFLLCIDIEKIITDEDYGILEKFIFLDHPKSDSAIITSWIKFSTSWLLDKTERYQFKENYKKEKFELFLKEKATLSVKNYAIDFSKSLYWYKWYENKNLFYDIPLINKLNSIYLKSSSIEDKEFLEEAKILIANTKNEKYLQMLSMNTINKLYKEDWNKIIKTIELLY